MGLDIVELALAVEDEFEVHLEDDWNGIRTVGDLHAVICAQLDSQRQMNHSACPSIPPFFAARDALVSLTWADPRAIRPSSSLSAIISYSHRREIWAQLQTLAQIRLPPLTLPASLVATLKAILVPSLLVTAIGGVVMFGPSGLLVSIYTTIACLVIGYYVTRPFALAFPKSCQTEADIVRHARAPIYPGQRSKPIDNKDKVWDKLLAIVSDQLDAPVEDITPHARFIEDLKCG